MNMKKLFLLALVALFGLNIANAQTVLVPGDIAITGFNMDGADENFSFVFLTDVEMGTVINFTDNGWKADNTWRANEGVETWTADRDYTAGEEVVLPSGAMNFAASGDQIIVYQNADDMVTGVNDQGAHVWQADATSSNTSAIPKNLTNGVNCVALAEKDNYIYDRSKGTTGTKEELLALLCNWENWIGHNTDIYTLSNAGFTVNAATVAVTGVSLDNTTLSIAEGASATLTATVAPSNATNKNVTWSSDTPAVATVDNNGLVSAVSQGTAVITVTTQDGGHTATCNVTVTVPVPPSVPVSNWAILLSLVGIVGASLFTLVLKK